MDKKQKQNEYSLAYGLLCFSVVYMHLNIMPTGFDIYSFGIDSKLFSEFLHLTFSFTVPLFFTLWGFLSGKYLTDTLKPLTFLIRKIIQFWPLYIIFSVPILLNMGFRTGVSSLMPIHLTICSILGFGDFFGSHIMIGLFLSLCSIAIVKSLPKPYYIFTVYTIFLIILSIFIPEGGSHPKQGLAFHTAYCTGVVLYRFNFFQPVKKLQKGITYSILFAGVICFLSYLLEHPIIPCDFPNSPGHLIMSVAATFTLIYVIKHSSRFIPKPLWVYICCIGNAAFAHLVIHMHIMNILVTTGELNKIHPILIQVVLLLATSPISIFLVYYPYLKIKDLLLKLLLEKRLQRSA